jgi:uncharacterized protein (TIGR03437 family)
VGLYQFNVRVPTALAPGDYDLLVNVGDQQIGYRIAVGQ